MKILVGVDLSESTETVVKKAEEIARALSAKVWLLHVAEPEPDFVGFDIEPEVGRQSRSDDFHAEHRQIQQIAERLRSTGIDVTGLLVQGETKATMLQEASKLDVDMIVVGSHGRGAVYRLLVGSVTEGILHKSKCPVLVVPTHARP